MDAFTKILLVGCGGFVGAVGRYLLSSLVREKTLQSVFPFSTLAVNVVGCFAIGLLLGLAEERGFFGTKEAQARLFLVTGILGSFTTFSTFAWDGLGLFRGGEAGVVVLYVAASVGLGFAAVWLGWKVVGVG